MKRLLLITLVAMANLCIVSCDTTHYNDPTIKIESSYGDIYVELYPKKAPKTVAGFLKFVDAGYFKNTSFYRVLKKEDQPSNAFKTQLIQGGLWQVNYKKQISIPGIEHESTQQTGLSHTNGVISLARDTLGSASTEFFICIGDDHVYDYGGEASNDGQGFAAFGMVVKGMAIVREINKRPDFDTEFKPPIEIYNIKRVK
ncbi:MAG: peptidylprolyl isomerase [Ginsengibacter sp.]|jgi:peptidyl-prolyl cis-trans isomerase A (cyclophilin A)